jgi:hypothetical protein
MAVKDPSVIGGPDLVFQTSLMSPIVGKVEVAHPRLLGA